MKKSNYILISLGTLLLSFMTIYFIYNKVNKEKIINPYYIKRDLSRIYFAKQELETEATNKEKWKLYIDLIRNLNTDDITYKTALLSNFADYTLTKSKYFKDTIALKILEKKYKEVYLIEKTYNVFSFDYDYNKKLYIEVLYELGKIDKAKEIEKEYHKNEYQKVPKKVRTWIDSELAKNTKNPIKDLNSPKFFNNTPGRIVGYIKGYNGKQALDFTTGMYYAENVFVQGSRDPILINIHPDGRFEADIPLSHPVFSKIFINNKWIPFYLEPDQTLAMIIDAKGLYPKEPRKNGFKNMLFLGNLAQVNYDLINYNLEDFNYDDFYKKTQKLSNDAYKKYRQEQLQENLENYQAYVSKRQITSKAAKILNNTILVDNAVYLFDFLQYHPTDILLEPLNKIYKPNAKDNFYEFLNTIPWNDPTLILTDQFSTFINRFEYLDRLKTDSSNGITSDRYIRELTKSWKAKDSIAQNTFGIDSTSFIYNIPKIRKLKFTCSFIKDKTAVSKYWNTIKTTSNPILINKAADIIYQSFKLKAQGSKIPNTKAGTILKNIIAPFKGKIIFIKFWNMDTGLHLLKSQLTKTIYPTIEKYKDEVAFIYITEENEYLKDRYQVFVKEHNLSNSFKISEDEMHHLRQLFKRSSSSFSVFINQEGKIMNNRFVLNISEIEKIMNPE